MAATLLRRLLVHPLTATLPVDDPETTLRRREIILAKPFLKKVYDEWYAMLAQALPAGPGPVLELGSGGGYCARFIPGLVTTEVFACPEISVVASAEHLPFAERSLRAVIMTDVLHHMTDIRRFFEAASRCLRRGGRILMIEPWLTPWSRFVYSRFHQEPYTPTAQEWGAPTRGPLSGANIALPWIIFARDRVKFEAEFPQFRIEQVCPFLPFRYLVSGGVSMRNLMPGFLHGFWATLERLLQSQMHRLGMFAFISLERL